MSEEKITINSIDMESQIGESENTAGPDKDHGAPK